MRTYRFVPPALLSALMFTLCGCGGSAPATPPGANAPPGAAGTGEGSTPHVELYTAADLQLGEIDPAMVEQGQKIYDVKCQACHSKGENRVVGPGWKGVTTRREPAWIMNMIVHTDAMLTSDAEAQKLFEECLVRMPNQNLNHDEAREMLEFMRTL